MNRSVHCQAKRNKHTCNHDWGGEGNTFLFIFCSLSISLFYSCFSMLLPLLPLSQHSCLALVWIEKFQTLPTKSVEVRFSNEVHKDMNCVKSDCLSKAIVDSAQLMRHDGMCLSTQCAKALHRSFLSWLQ